MDIREPSYYRAFQCLASSCPDSCCKEWDVSVDPESAARYRSLPGALGARLRAALADIDRETVMIQSDGRCPMWRRDGLCQIQAELGESALCQVCRTFPRLRHDYGDFVELGLELSCPEAARLILSSPAWETVSHPAPGGDAPEYDLQAMSTLTRSRRDVLLLLENPKYTLGQALAILLLYAYAVQEELDGGAPAQMHPEEDLASARNLAGAGNIQDILRFYQGLEILTQAWHDRLSAPAPDAPWTQPLRALARYGVERYWLQAVSDYDLVGRAKLVIASCLLVKALGGDPIQTAQLSSKEIENDPENVDAILDAAYTSPALADTALLGLLLTET